MTKEELLTKVFAEELYLNKRWLIILFTILEELPEDMEELTLIDGKLTAFGEKITDFRMGHALFAPTTPYNVPKGLFLSYPTGGKTSAGIALTNALLVEYPFKGKLPFYTKPVKPGTFNKDIGNALKKGTVELDEVKRFESALSLMKALDRWVSETVTRKAIDLPKGLLDFRDELLKKYEGQMGDSSVVADIEQQLVAKVREYLKDDPSMKFFIKGKTINIALIKMFLFYGASEDLADASKVHVTKTSLEEGWGAKDMVTISNAIRGGSDSRGSETALGGEAMQVAARIFQAYGITVDDCGSNEGLSVTFTKSNYQDFVGCTVVGNKNPLTEDTAKGLVGRIVKVRMPSHCWVKETKYCKVCIGESVVDSQTNIVAHVVEAMGVFMGMFMAAMHGKELTTVEYKYEELLT